MPRPVLALPDGWVLDGAARARLEHQLARLAGTCSGVVAPLVPLAPGASHRVAAEWRALEPLDRVESAGRGPVAGAVLARPGTAVRVHDDGVDLGPGEWVLDPGAAAHDPWRSHAGPEDASPEGRPPFPWRPVVLFLGTEDDPDLADWCRVAGNGLLALDVEARIAVPAPTGGLHLTRPCAPSAATVAALAPDVVVALDPQALDLAPQWLGDDRSAVVVEMTQHTSALVETVPWRIGVARGRVRARIGRGVRPPQLADLVRRCCAGPQPLPPRDRGRREGPPTRPPRDRSRARGALDPALRIVAVGAPGPERDARLLGLADHVAAFDGRVEMRGLEHALDAEVLDADVVVLHGPGDTGPLHDLAAHRRARGRATVVDVVADDVRIDRDGRAHLTGGLVELARAAGAATAPGRAVRDALVALGVRSLVLPALLPRARVEELAAARPSGPPPAAPVVGWRTGGPTREGDGERAALGAALADLLAAHDDLRVEVLDGDGGAAGPDHPRRTVRTALAPGDLAAWSVQCWTAPAAEVARRGDLRPAAEAQLLGVPTVVARGHPAVDDGLVAGALVVGDPEDPAAWRRVLDAVLGAPGVRSACAAEAAARADARYGPVGAGALVNRLLGWIARGTAP